MTTCKHKQLNYIEVCQPRWHDRRALLSAYKVGEHNKVRFTKTKSMPEAYYISGRAVKRYKQESNGAIMCYAVPLAEFEVLKIQEHCEHEYN